jgi:hypothetical protein
MEDGKAAWLGREEERTRRWKAWHKRVKATWHGIEGDCCGCYDVMLLRKCVKKLAVVVSMEDGKVFAWSGGKEEKTRRWKT